MSPSEVVSGLEAYKIKISERNLFNWVKMGLLPTPETGNRGRAKGKFTDYPTETLFQYYAAWRLKNDDDVSLSAIANIRRDILMFQSAKEAGTGTVRKFLKPDHYAWLAFYHMAVAKISVDVPLILTRLEENDLVCLTYPGEVDPETLPRIGALIQFDNSPEAKIITHFTADGRKIQIYPRPE